MRRLRSFQESRKWYEQTMNIDNFEGRSVALGRGSVENRCARWSRRDRWPRSRPRLEPLGGAAERASRPARRSETVLRALQKDLPGTIWEPSRDQLLEVSQIFLGRLRASKSSTRLMWRFLWRTNSEKNKVVVFER